jgi:hypothetical protein
MGRIGALAAGLKAGCANGRCDAGIIGWTGVPNAGDDEKTNASFCFRIESIAVCIVVFQTVALLVGRSRKGKRVVAWWSGSARVQARVTRADRPSIYLNYFLLTLSYIEPQTTTPSHPHI